jgi:hypothetical protein
MEFKLKVKRALNYKSSIQQYLLACLTIFSQHGGWGHQNDI